jgi:heme-degrading monooxygenase HmoA
MIYELRTYTAAPGQADKLKRRFRDHTLVYFRRHGIELVGCWEPLDRPEQFVYLTRFADEAASKAAWAGFAGDADWRRVKAESETEGPLLATQSVQVLRPTEFSGLLT